MSSMIPNPMLSPTPLQVPGQISAPPTDNPSYQVAPEQSFGLPTSNMLPSQINFGNGAPAGAYTDSTYLADDAALRQQIGQQYAALLSQLGYGDPQTGQAIPGSIVNNANIKESGYLADLQDQQIAESQNAQDTGTATSGLRAQNLESAQRPTYQNIAQLSLDTGSSLNDIYNQAQGLVSQYNTQQQQNLASAAARNLTSLQSNALVAGHAGLPAPQGSPHDLPLGSPNTFGPTPAPQAAPAAQPTQLGSDALHGQGALTPLAASPAQPRITIPASGYSAGSGANLH